MNNTFIRVFVGTSWDMYFLWKTSRNMKRDILFIGRVIKEDLGSLFELQGFEVPDLHEMLKELSLSCFEKQDDAIFSCQEKKEFVEKYTKHFSEILTKI